MTTEKAPTTPIAEAYLNQQIAALIYAPHCYQVQPEAARLFIVG